LAAAGTNAGAAASSGKIRRLPGELTPWDDQTFFEIRRTAATLRRETRDYVPKLIARR